jgi:glucose-1-phosphate adenylyltransferase
MSLFSAKRSYQSIPKIVVLGFHEKTAQAPTIAGEPHSVYASMGNYIFSARTLLRELEADALRSDSGHDFGHDILPSLLGRAAMYAYDYQANAIPGESADVPAYWRDVGKRSLRSASESFRSFIM